MKVGQPRNNEVRLYLEDEHDHKLSTLIRFSTRRLVHIGEVGPYLLFKLPQDREHLFSALRTFRGPNLGRWAFEQVMEKMR